MAQAALQRRPTEHTAEPPTASYDDLTRSSDPATESTAEPLEILRDLCRTNTRLRLYPPGQWEPTLRRVFCRRWHGYGHTVTLWKTPLYGWSLEIDDHRVCRYADRQTAFREAAWFMRETAAEQ